MTHRLMVWEYYNCLYTTQTIEQRLEKKYQIPDIIIGFDAGLNAYGSWKSMMERIEHYKIKAVFTDHSMHNMAYYPAQFPTIQQCRVTNPFRVPMVISMIKDHALHYPRNGAFAVFNC